MILHLAKNTPKEILNDLKSNTQVFINEKNDHFQLINSSSYKKVNDLIYPYIIDKYVFDDDLQLGSATYTSNRLIRIDNIEIGRGSGQFPVIMGPCSVETLDQMELVGDFLNNNQLKCIRGGTYKPRTSPYSFEGLKSKGLEILKSISNKHQLITFTEVRDATQIDEIIASTDVVQVGAKSMYDHGILKALGECQKPVLLKRGFATTLQEFVQAAEFILCRGNENVILCERGIRTFENKTRFTLDLCGVAWLKEYTNLPIIIDPSHALGYRYGIIDLCKAAVAMDVDGLLIEMHPDPENALSDANQQLNFSEAKELLNTIKPYLALEKKIMV